MEADAANQIRIVIAEDHAVVRRALVVMLGTHPDLSVVGEATNGEEAVALAKELAPDVVILDVRMEGMDGVEATRLLQEACPEVAILILTGFDDVDILRASVEAGAHGFLLKDATEEELLEAIRRLVKGESLITPRLLRSFLADVSERQEGSQPTRAELTPRELEVLEALTRGLRNEDIARELVISEKTVKCHLTSIFAKLQVEGRSQAILYAIRHGLVEV